MYRGGLDRFKKAQSLEPFSVAVVNSASSKSQPTAAAQSVAVASKVGPEPQKVTQIGGGQSTWQPPDWAIEPRPGFYYLEVVKDGEVLDRINLDQRRHVFGRQIPTCDFVLDHQSVSRQHAAVVPHKNGSIYVIDMGSVHGTFVANERLTKDNPTELEAGQSLRFAASSRIYILRKNTAALFPTPALPPGLDLPSPPDPSDEDAVVAYNTLLNRYGLSKSDLSSMSDKSPDPVLNGRPAKRSRKARVAFKDHFGGNLVEVVGISDGADVETEPGPIGVKEGSLVGKYESLVQSTVIPKGKGQASSKEDGISPKGVTEKLQQVLNRVKSAPKSGIYDDLYGDPLSGTAGYSWAYKSDGQADTGKSVKNGGGKADADSLDNSDDLFGD